MKSKYINKFPKFRNLLSNRYNPDRIILSIRRALSPIASPPLKRNHRARRLRHIFATSTEPSTTAFPISNVNMSDTASNPKEQTRHIIVHRRRTPYRRFKHFVTRLTIILTVSFIATSIVVDTLHPRTLNPDHVATLSALLDSPSTPSTQLLKNANIPTRHAKQSIATVITGNPPTLVKTHLLYWTPVESLTLLTYPASPPIIHHAVPLNLHFYPFSNVSVTSLPSASSPPIIPRFTPYVIHPTASASLLEHADGFLPARALQSALYSSLITMHPRILLDALVETSVLFLRYLETYIYLPQITIPEPLGWARRISRTARERRAKRANKPNTVP